MCASVCLSIVLDKYSRKCISMTHICFLTTGSWLANQHSDMKIFVSGAIKE